MNLIHIDTEGYDYEVIKIIPFSELDVDMIMFEHKRLSKSDFKKAIKHLLRNGCKTGIRNDSDSIAIKRDV